MLILSEKQGYVLPCFATFKLMSYKGCITTQESRIMNASHLLTKTGVTSNRTTKVLYAKSFQVRFHVGVAISGIEEIIEAKISISTLQNYKKNTSNISQNSFRNKNTTIAIGKATRGHDLVPTPAADRDHVLTPATDRTVAPEGPIQEVHQEVVVTDPDLVRGSILDREGILVENQFRGDRSARKAQNQEAGVDQGAGQSLGKERRGLLVVNLLIVRNSYRRIGCVTGVRNRGLFLRILTETNALGLSLLRSDLCRHCLLHNYII